MNEKEFHISSLEQVKHIVHIASSCALGMEAVDVRGQVADASSILGMLSLDYKHPVQVRSRDKDSLDRISEHLSAN